MWFGKTVKTLFSIVLCILLFCTVVLTGYAVWIARAFHKTVLDVDAAVTSLSGVVEQERKAQTDQTREFNKTIADVHDLVIHTDVSLNGNKHLLGVIPQLQGVLIRLDTNLNEKLLPAAGTLLQDSDTGVKVAFVAMHDTAEAATSTLHAYTTDADDFHHLLTDPEIDDLFGKFNVAALHFDNMTADGQAMTHDLRIKVHDLTKPRSHVKEIFSYVPDVIRITAAFAP